MCECDARNGARGMSKSQAYPVQFGCTVARLHVEYVSRLNGWQTLIVTSATVGSLRLRRQYKH